MIFGILMKTPYLSYNKMNHAIPTVLSISLQHWSFIYSVINEISQMVVLRLLCLQFLTLV